MTHPHTVTVTLGRDHFIIPLLTLGAVEKIEGFLRDPALMGRAAAHSKAIIAAAIQDTQPDFDIDKQPGSMSDLNVALPAILGFSGFLPPAPVAEPIDPSVNPAN